MRAEAEQEYVDYLRARLPYLHRTAYLLCGDADRADNVDAYVHRMLVNEFLGERRRPWARVLLSDQPLDLVVAPASAVEDRDLVRTALAQLGPRQRAVLVLRYFCDLSVADTASALDCSTGNVKSQTARGLAALRRFLTGTADPALTTGKENHGG